MTLTATNISKSFNNSKVLENVSLNIKKNSVTVLLGPSGCGKSTLLRIIAGLEQPDSGTISRDSKKIGFVFQEDRLLEWSSVEKNIRFVTDEQKDYNAILSLLGIESLQKRNVRQLSGGERQRVSIARAFLYGAETILMDEPFKSLDQLLKRQIIKDLSLLLKNQPRTILLVTHDIRVAVTLGETIHLLSKNPATVVKTITPSLKRDNLLSDSKALIRAEIKLLNDIQPLVEK